MSQTVPEPTTLPSTDNSQAGSRIESSPPLDRRGLFDRQTVIICALLFCGSFAIYALTSYDKFTKRSDHIHFIDLAQSYLSGQLDTLWTSPWDKAYSHERLNDWSHLYDIKLQDGTKWRGRFVDRKRYGYNFYTTNGKGLVISQNYIARSCGKSGRSLCKKRKNFVSFPPVPAVIMMPAVKIWGWQTNDVVITIFSAALNVVLMFLLMRLLMLRGYSRRSVLDQILLAVLFGFGTVAYYCCVRGQVWFTALTFGATFNLFYLLAALDSKHPFLAGVALALGFGTRTPLLFASIFFFAQVLLPAGRIRRTEWGIAVKKLALFCLPCLTVGILLLIANKLRFDSITEFGHSYLGGAMGDRIRLKGMFGTRHLSRNLTAAFSQLPVFIDTKPYIKISLHGLALWFTTPLFALVLWPKRKGYLHNLLWCSIVAIALPIFLYQNTGWRQFGFRFSLDFVPYLVMLMAIGGRKFKWPFWALLVFSLAVGLFGAITYDRMPEFYFSGFFEP